MKLIKLYERYLREAEIDWKKAGATMDYDDPPKSLSGKGPSGKYEPPAKDDSSTSDSLWGIKWEPSDNDTLARLISIGNMWGHEIEDQELFIRDVFNGNINNRPDVSKLTPLYIITIIEYWESDLQKDKNIMNFAGHPDLLTIDKFVRKINVI